MPKKKKNVYMNDAVRQEGDYALIFDKTGMLVSMFVPKELEHEPIPQTIKDICKHVCDIDLDKNKNQERRFH
jgi:hypothetical protein